MYHRRSGWVGGLILIGLGVLFLLQQYAPEWVGGWLFLVGLGVIFLVAYLLNKQYGFLIPGCILTGLGIGVALIGDANTDSPQEGGVVVIALGLSFLAIWLVDMIVARGRPGHWWPLIPGGLLTVVGLTLVTDNQALWEKIGQWWPLIFILLGVWIIFDRVIRRPSE